jgi:hypothetical protein
MNSDTLSKYHLLILSIISFVRISAYLYWIYWFRVIILPVILISEQGLFYLEQIPLILSIIDLLFVLLLLVTKGRTWFILLIGSFVSIIYSWSYLIGFAEVAAVSGMVIILASSLQIALLFNTYSGSRSVLLQ